MQAEKEKIINRVKNLLAMANDVSSPNEAMIAAKRARSLMDKYQISKADIGEKNKFGIFNCRDYAMRHANWKQFLSVDVAKWNDCIAEFSDYKHDQGFSSLFKGFSTDVIIAGHMFKYLVDTIERLCKQSGVKGRGSISQYKLAAGNAVCARIRKLIEERQNTFVQSDGRSLVVIKKTLVENKFGTAKYAKTKTRNPKRDEILAALLGHKDGNKISLSPHLETESNNQRLI